MEELITRYKESDNFQKHYEEIRRLSAAEHPAPNQLAQIIQQRAQTLSQTNLHWFVRMQSLIWILDTIRQDQTSDLGPSAVILIPGLIFLAGENRSNYLGFMASVIEQIARRAPEQLFSSQRTFVEYLFKNIEQLVAKPDSDPLDAIFSNLTLSRESLDYVVQNIINGQHPLKEKIMAPILDRMVRTE